MKHFWVLFLVTISVFSQTKGIVKDSISGNVVPYVNIGVEGENIATTSEENGTFHLNKTGKGETLIFSAVGFKKKKVALKNATTVLLQPEEYQLEEVFVSNQKNTKELEIGDRKNSVLQAFDNGPKIDAKYFPYNTNYKKNRYIKAIRIRTDSQIDSALVKIKILAVDSDGFPGESMLKKDLLIRVKKGVVNQRISVADLHLVFPKKGIFIVFEKLLIEKNKIEKTIFDANSQQSFTKTSYFPYLLYNLAQTDDAYTYFAGKWHNKNTEQKSNSEKNAVYEPAINLILSN